MDTLQILIVEDDLSFALELEIMVQKIGYQVVDRVDNSAEALEVIFSKEPDLILMDIDIKGSMTGVEIGKKIKHLNIPILYITSFDNEAYYEKALQSNLAGYMIKPISPIELRSAVHVAMKNAALGHRDTHEDYDDFILRDALFFRKKDNYFRVNFSDIVYVESQDKYCLTHTSFGESFLARISMHQMEALLPSDQFIRIHRSYIVALSKIKSVNFFEGTVQIDQKALPLSREKSKQLKEQIQWLK
jgi:DNA-binding LytR/AlgR family response regulator